MNVPLGLAGAVTIVALVGLGTFVYPWLLKKPYGVGAVTLATLALTGLFFMFDAGRADNESTSLALGFIWAIAPAVAGVIVRRIQK